MHIPVLTPTSQNQNIELSNLVSSQLRAECAHPFLLQAKYCLFVPIVRLQTRDYLNISNIIVPLTIFMFIPIVRLNMRDYLNISNIVVPLTISMFLLSPPKSYNFDLSKPGFKPLEIWMRSFIPAAGQIWFFYKNFEATDQRIPQYIKYYSTFDHFHVSTTTPKIL